MRVLRTADRSTTSPFASPLWTVWADTLDLTRQNA